MLTSKQKEAISCYHWWDEFFFAVREHRTVFFISTRRPVRATTL